MRLVSPTLSEEALGKVVELLDELRECAAEGVPVLVEGVDDERALRELDVEGRIFRVSSGSKTLLNFLEGLVGYERVIILTDFDRAGDKLAKFCAEHLQRLGVDPMVELREKLKVLLRKDLKDVEGLASFIRTSTALKS